MTQISRYSSVYIVIYRSRLSAIHYISASYCHSSWTSFFASQCWLHVFTSSRYASVIWVYTCCVYVLHLVDSVSELCAASFRVAASSRALIIPLLIYTCTVKCKLWKCEASAKHDSTETCMLCVYFVGEVNHRWVCRHRQHPSLYFPGRQQSFLLQLQCSVYSVLA